MYFEDNKTKRNLISFHLFRFLGATSPFAWWNDAGYSKNYVSRSEGSDKKWKPNVNDSDLCVRQIA